MFPTTILQVYFQGEWHEIGWRAGNPKSAADLKEHGQRLANEGGLYRLVRLSDLDEAVHEFEAATNGVTERVTCNPTTNRHVFVEATWGAAERCECGAKKNPARRRRSLRSRCADWWYDHVTRGW